jgi:predicted SnoaL-like aldol condensation-catalyzing enzyme
MMRGASILLLLGVASVSAATPLRATPRPECRGRCTGASDLVYAAAHGRQTPGGSGGGMDRTEQESRNLALVLAMFDAVLKPMDSSAVDRFIAPDYIQHSPMAPPGRDALKAFLDMIRKATPLAVHDIKRSFVDGDHVIVHYRVRRTPDDPGFAVIDIFRVAGGMIAEHWDVTQDVQSGGPNPNPMF